MLIERLRKKYGYNVPIFTEEILECMNDYSKQRIYQLINDSVNKNELVRFDTGVYYLPTSTILGQSIISIEEVAIKKYIQNENNIFGIFGKNVIDFNFMLTTQVPKTLEIITNNESREVREIKIRDRTFILRKSRTKITNENVHTYTILELFNGIKLNQCNEIPFTKKFILDYIKDHNITYTDISQMANFFPAKAMKNLIISGVLYEITQQ